MECRNIRKNLIFYLDRELSEEQMNAIGKHLDECPRCSAFLRQLRNDLRLIDEERKPAVSPWFFTRLSARLDERPIPEEQTVWTRVLQPAFFTLLLMAAIYGGFRVGYHASTPVDKPEQVNVMPGMDDLGDEPIETFLLDER
jgi:anti-sigma factor RsiW